MIAAGTGFVVSSVLSAASGSTTAGDAANGGSTEKSQAGGITDSNHVHVNPYPNANFHSHGDADAKDWAHAEIASYSAAAAMRPPRQFAIAVDPFQYGAAVVPTLRFVDFS